MVNAVLPIYLVLHLGFSPLAFGIFDGLYQGMTGLLRIAGGPLGRPPRPLQGSGRARVRHVGGGQDRAARLQYASLPSRPSSWPTAPARDCAPHPATPSISLSSAPHRMAESFGVHRALDTAGALAGPVLAFLLLSAVPGGYKRSSPLAFGSRSIGVAVFVLFGGTLAAWTRTRRGKHVFPVGPGSCCASLDSGASLAAGAVLSLVTIGDALVYLTFEQRTSMSLRYFPLLFAGTASVYVLLALPLGRLADRVGPGPCSSWDRRCSFLSTSSCSGRSRGAPCRDARRAGHPLRGIGRCPRRSRLEHLAGHVPTSGLAFLGSAMGLAQFAASLLFGALRVEGPTVAVQVFGVGLVIALVVSFVLLRPMRTSEQLVGTRETATELPDRTVDRVEVLVDVGERVGASLDLVHGRALGAEFLKAGVTESSGQELRRVDPQVRQEGEEVPHVGDTEGSTLSSSPGRGPSPSGAIGAPRSTAAASGACSARPCAISKSGN